MEVAIKFLNVPTAEPCSLTFGCRACDIDSHACAQRTTQQGARASVPATAQLVTVKNWRGLGAIDWGRQLSPGPPPPQWPMIHRQKGLKWGGGGGAGHSSVFWKVLRHAIASGPQQMPPAPPHFYQLLSPSSSSTHEAQFTGIRSLVRTPPC